MITNARERWLSVAVRFAADGVNFDQRDDSQIRFGFLPPLVESRSPLSYITGGQPIFTLPLPPGVSKIQVKVFGPGFSGDLSQFAADADRGFYAWPAALSAVFDFGLPLIEVVSGLKVAPAALDQSGAWPILLLRATLACVTGVEPSSTTPIGPAQEDIVTALLAGQSRNAAFLSLLKSVAVCAVQVPFERPAILAEMLPDAAGSAALTLLSLGVSWVRAPFMAYGVVEAGLAVYDAATSAPLVVFNVNDPAIAPTGTFQGLVYNAVTLAGIAGASIDIHNSSGLLVSHTASGGNGLWSAPNLPGGSYQIAVSASGFVATTIVSQVLIAPATVVEPIPLVPSVPTPGGISGTLVSATTGVGISGSAIVELRAGMNALTGTPAATLQTSTGSYQFSSVAAGVYTVLTRAQGFIDASRTGIVVGAGVVRTGQDVTLSPITSGTSARIVLTWGATPPDIDSHLTGPLSGQGGRFWIKYFEKGSCVAPPYACLDVDDVDGFGPETVTITQVVPGVYRYYVYNFTDKDFPSSTTLGSSGARVQLYLGNVLAQTFFVPQGTGNAWAVFEWDGQNVHVVNQLYAISGVPQPLLMGSSRSLSPFEAEMRQNFGLLRAKQP
jgi:hypothetical protein